MVESLTQNYKWTKPEVTKSPTTWGGFLNDDLDSIDALVFSNQMGITPIGGMLMFAGDTAPVNFLMCDGLVYQNSAIPLLAPILKNRYNAGTSAVAGTSSAVPNLTDKFGRGASATTALGATGGAYTVTVNLANLPAHNHPASQDAHVHAAWQGAHNHTIVTGNHAHGIATGGHSHNIHTGGHSHGLDHQVPTTNAGGQVGAQVGGWLFQSINTTGVGDLGGYTDAAGNLGGNTDTAGNLGGYTDTQTPAVAVDTRQPAVYTANTGGGTPLTLPSPPYLGINFIIRYQ